METCFNVLMETPTATSPSTALWYVITSNGKEWGPFDATELAEIGAPNDRVQVRQLTAREAAPHLPPRELAELAEAGAELAQLTAQVDALKAERADFMASATDVAFADLAAAARVTDMTARNIVASLPEREHVDGPRTDLRPLRTLAAELAELDAAIDAARATWPELIRAARAAGHSSRAIAKALGCSHTYVNNIA